MENRVFESAEAWQTGVHRDSDLHELAAADP